MSKSVSPSVSLCCVPTCPWLATHGVLWSSSQHTWSIRKDRNVGHANRIWCRWHATVQAVQRNAGATDLLLRGEDAHAQVGVSGPEQPA